MGNIIDDDSVQAPLLESLLTSLGDDEVAATIAIEDALRERDTLREQLAAVKAELERERGEHSTQQVVMARAHDAMREAHDAIERDRDAARNELAQCRRTMAEIHAERGLLQRERDHLKAVVADVRKVVDDASVRAVRRQHVDYRYASGVGDVASRVAAALNTKASAMEDE